MKCGYCACAASPSLLQCRTCKRSFCTSVHCGGRSHILMHSKESNHCDWQTLDGRRVICGICKETNMYELGGFSAGGKKFKLRCRSGCKDTFLSEAELSEWQPIVVKRAVAPWLAQPQSHENRLMFSGAIEKLEELWNSGARMADIAGIQAFRDAARRPGTKKIAQLKEEFDSVREYVRIFGDLVEQEREFCEETETRDIFSVSECDWLSEGTEARLRLQVSPSKLSVGLEVQLMLDTPFQKWAAQGRIMSFETGKLASMVVSFDIDRSQAQFPTAVKIGFQLKIDTWNEVSFDRMQTALSALRQDKSLDWLHAALLRPSRAPSVAVPDQRLFTVSTDGNSRLNASQREALELAVTHQVSLVQGPPGTGKSHLAVALVETVVSEGKVLVCAPSNGVADYLADQLANTGLFDVVRLVARSKEESLQGLSRVALHTLCAEEEPHAKTYKQARQKLLEMKTSYRSDPLELRKLLGVCLKIENARLDEADVIVATCIGAGDSRLESRRFRTVLIDEATQTMEPACLVPAVLSTHRLVLVGDHKQLGPVVLSDEAGARGLARSMFERLVALKVPRKRLDIQYRMHPEIAAFPSRAFYEGTLQNGVTAYERRFFAPSFPWNVSGNKTKGGLPVFFWHTSTTEEWDSRGSSYINRVEARRVQQLLDALPESADVGVITFYAGQCTLLMSELEERENCEIASVDGFQGREKDVIILSTVRSNDQSLIGFLEDPRRLNVAITRAKRLLIVCGNARMLNAARPSVWPAFIDHLHARGCIFEGDSVASLRQVYL